MSYDGSCRGTVEKVSGGKALVNVADAEACSRCGGASTCSFASPRKGRSLWVLDPVGVQAGNHVRVEISGEGLLAASFVLYGIPLLGLLVGALAGQVSGGEKRALLGAGAGLALSIPLVRLLGNRIPRRARYAARIVSVEAPPSS